MAPLNVNGVLLFPVFGGVKFPSPLSAHLAGITSLLVEASSPAFLFSRRR